MKSRFALVAHLVGSLFLSSVGFGYGVEGHKIVALIADNHITSNTRAAVKAILGDQAMSDVSSWADQERSRNRKTAGWHYVDFEISDGKILPESAKGGTVIEAITSQSAILSATDSDPQDRKRALMFVIHFLGDMHQPLHCADNFDHGGNSVKVDFLGHPYNLHSLWDSGMLQYMMKEGPTSMTVEQVAKSIDQEHQNLWPSVANGTPIDWAHESHEAAKKYAYSYLKNDTLSSTTVTLGRDYYDLCRPVLRKEIAEGGYRLATTLNSILDAPGRPAISWLRVANAQTTQSEIPKD